MRQRTMRLTHHEFAELYAELCDVITREDLRLYDGTEFKHTSPYARKIALLIVERLAHEGYLEYR